MRNFLSKYFNEKTCAVPSGIVPQTLATAVFTGLIAWQAAAHGSIIGFAAAAITTAVTLGQINLWQKQATGKPFWKPWSPIIGL